MVTSCLLSILRERGGRERREAVRLGRHREKERMNKRNLREKSVIDMYMYYMCTCMYTNTEGM